MHKISSELKNTSYELFIAGLSILSVLNLFLLIYTDDQTVSVVIYFIDGVLSLVFIIDFTFRLLTAESKKEYFFRQFGWADLLASIPLPQAKILRLFRIIRAWRMLRMYGVRNLINNAFNNRGGSALLVVLFLIILVMEFGSVFIITAERTNPEANIKTASDAMWWVYVTITTVGYGDRYPVTNTGRFIGVFVLTLGVGLFGVLTGFLANVFLSPNEEPPKSSAAGPANSTDPKVKLAELKELLAKQKLAQEELEMKIADLEQVL